jgi:hypothetical protein
MHKRILLSGLPPVIRASNMTDKVFQHSKANNRKSGLVTNPDFFTAIAYLLVISWFSMKYGRIFHEKNIAK